MIAPRTFWRLVSGATLLVSLAIALYWPMRVSHDSAMYLSMGELLRLGGVPYVDMIDLNPPLIVYLNAIPATLAWVTGAPLSVTFLVVVWLFTVWSVEASRRVLTAGGASESATGAVPAALAGFSLLVVVANGSGQREHLFVLGFLPFLLLRCTRTSGGGAHSRRMALVVGAVAGVVICLKPHFLAVALAPEIYWAARRGWRSVVTPEVTAVVLVGVLYAAHFLWLPDAMYDEFFGRWVPFIASGYHVYGRSFGAVASAWYWWAPPLAGVALGAVWRRDPMWATFGPGLSIVTVAGVVSYAFQGKGWPIHVLFAQATLAVGLSLMVAAALDSARSARAVNAVRRGQRLATAAAVVVLISAAGTVTLLAVRPRGDASVAALTAGDPLAALIVARTSPGDPVLFLSTSVTPTFPLLTNLERRQGSRYMFLFPLPMFYSETRRADDGSFPYRRPDASRAADERRFRAELAEDIARLRPRLIMVPPECQACPEGFTVRGYLDAWEFRATAMGAYRELAPSFGTSIFMREDSGVK